MANPETAAHMPIIKNGQWACCWCGRILRPLRRVTSCQVVRKILTAEEALNV